MFKFCVKIATQSIVAAAVFFCLSLNVGAASSAETEALFSAIANDNSGSLSTLFLRGADPNARNAKGQTALILALQEGSEKATAALLAHPGIRIDDSNAAGETALMMAALKGRLGAMRALLARGAQVNRAGWSPLHYAAAGPETAAVALLLDRGAEINARSPNETTPLMMAARYGAIDSVALLLQRGAHARLANAQNLEAADFARAAGRERMADELAQRPAR